MPKHPEKKKPRKKPKDPMRPISAGDIVRAGGFGPAVGRRMEEIANRKMTKREINQLVNENLRRMAERENTRKTQAFGRRKLKHR